MSDGSSESLKGTWGCLASVMIAAGLFFTFVQEGVGSTEYELNYASVGLALAGVAILIALKTKRLR